jgi:inosine-uridine nucleoside N-ribohydrolase
LAGEANAETMTNLTFTLLTALTLAPLAVLLAADKPTPLQPNILVIVTDDQGYGELSCHGNAVLRTPHLDRLHDESVRFTDFHVAPMCTPIRGQLLAGVDRTVNIAAADVSATFRVPLRAGSAELQTWFTDDSGKEIGGAYYVYAQRLQTSPPVKLILDTDMSGDADDAGTLALLHALADRGECELLATIVNRADLTKASAAAVDAINTYYGRPNIPIGTDKVGPTALKRTSLYTPGLRDGFPNDIGPDDKAPDALDVYRRVLAAQPDGSVTVCSVGALSNLAELWRREPALVRAKIRRVIVMGGQFPPAAKPETNIATHPEAARLVAAEWPTEIVWQGFEVGHPVFTGEALKQTPVSNPVRRAFELRLFGKRPSIEGGQPSYDQAAAFYAVRGANAELWSEERGGRVVIDQTGFSGWVADAASPHVMVTRVCAPALLARQIEALMVAPPKNPTPGKSK